MQSTDLRDCDAPASIDWLHTARLRAVFLQCQMCPAAMVIIKEHFEIPAQTALVEYDYVIEAPPSSGTDHSFDIARCHGDRGAESTCLVPIAFT